MYLIFIMIIEVDLGYILDVCVIVSFVLYFGLRLRKIFNIDIKCFNCMVVYVVLEL